jgi:hypothetical protein
MKFLLATLASNEFKKSVERAVILDYMPDVQMKISRCNIQ